LPRARRFQVAAGIAIASATTALCTALALGEVIQIGNVRVAVSGDLSPTKLPRNGAAPIAVSVGGKITSTDAAGPPQLRKMEIAINRNGRFTTRGLPLCRIGHIDPSTSDEALSACRSSLIGSGSFSADVKFPEQSPFPSNGKILAFNGRLRGQPAILAHIFGTKPVPTSYVLPFSISPSKGTFGTVLTASLPRVTGEWGYVTGVSIKLWRRFSFDGRRQSYLSAGCPAPAGFPSASFRLVRTSFSFADGKDFTTTLSRRCKVKG
jgi:hypothetical protein